MITLPQKYTVENSKESITFSVPFRKLWADILGAGIYALVSFAIVVYAIVNRSMPTSNMAIPAPLIPFLILIFVLLVMELLWSLYGVEILEVSNTRIVMKHRIFGFGLSKRFRSNKVGGVFVSRNKIDDQFSFQLSKGFKLADFTKGMVAINYGKTLFGRTITYRFGANLTEVEAQQIVNLIHEKSPQYRSSPVKKTG